MLTRWLTQALTAKPLHRLCAWVIQRFWKIPVICTHTHAHKSNPIIRIVRHTLFRDTHVASRSTLFGLGEPTLDIKGRCSILFLSLPLPLPVSSGLVFFFSFFIYCHSWSLTESFCYSTRFYPFLFGKCWFSPILPHVSHGIATASFVQQQKLCTFLLLQNLCCFNNTSTAWILEFSTENMAEPWFCGQRAMATASLSSPAPHTQCAADASARSSLMRLMLILHGLIKIQA